MQTEFLWILRKIVKTSSRYNFEAKQKTAQIPSKNT